MVLDGKIQQALNCTIRIAVNSPQKYSCSMQSFLSPTSPTAQLNHFRVKRYRLPSHVDHDHPEDRAGGHGCDY